MSDSLEQSVPEGWAFCTLGEVASSVKGKKPENLFSERGAGLIPYIDIRAFEMGDYRKFTNPDSAKVASEGDLLIVWDGARSGLVGRMPCEGAVGSTLAVLHPLLIDTDYLQWFLQANFDFINSNIRGTGIPHVDPGILWSIEYPVAPLVEQKRIVAKVEALLPRVRSVQQRLAAVPAILKRFRQAVLSHACSGKLTEDWRGTQADSDADAEDLLLQIQRERPHRYRKNNSGRMNEPIPASEDPTPEHPEDWVCVSLDQLICLVTSGSRGWAKYYSDAGPLFIRAQNINTDQLELTNVAHVSPPKSAEGERTQIERGDLLITITGANVTKSAAVIEDIGLAYVSQHVALARPVKPELTSFLYLWIVSKEHGRAKLEGDAYGAGKPGLNLTQIREMPVALPSLAEQHEIVRRVEALFALANSIEKKLQVAKKQAETLTQSILAKAFRGELVPTEADLALAEGRDYETAEQLLARIRNESPTRKPIRKRAKRSTGASR